MSCHIMNDDIIFYDIININELIQGSSGITPAMKEGKLKVNILQVDETEMVHTLWPMRFSLTCELLQGKTISSNQ